MSTITTKLTAAPTKMTQSTGLSFLILVMVKFQGFLGLFEATLNFETNLINVRK